MWGFVLGVLLVALKLGGVPFLAHVNWWWLTLPFVLAAAWWAFADHVGITQQRAMADEITRARERRERQYEALGMRAPRHGPPPRRGKP